ncbi:hypothetical protein EC973_007081 [Apophysomyces ossiformis]|uniref:Uncharacterized protein n=1 Tax=Apophysomyces ossiformis TaxID=679940 RepID=A0A8H7BT31_9FUNG|nr:hypothetical protein EC973_007081 [Apophysomyces ossiformis]
MRWSNILFTGAAFFAVATAASIHAHSTERAAGTDTTRNSRLMDVQPSTAADDNLLNGMIKRSPDNEKPNGEVVVPEREPVDGRVLKRAFLMRLLKAKRDLGLQPKVVETEMDANSAMGKVENTLNRHLLEAQQKMDDAGINRVIEDRPKSDGSSTTTTTPNTSGHAGGVKPINQPGAPGKVVPIKSEPQNPPQTPPQTPPETPAQTPAQVPPKTPAQNPAESPAQSPQTTPGDEETPKGLDGKAVDESPDLE